MSTPVDPPITITLPLSAWDVVTAHLMAGVYYDVASIIADISNQANAQIERATKAVQFTEDTTASLVCEQRVH